MHTSSMKITEYDFQNVITPLLIDLMTDPGFLQTDPDAIAAVEKIREVCLFNFQTLLISRFIPIRITCPCDLYPLTPHFYIVKLGCTGVYIFFHFALKHRLWLFIRTASMRRF